MILNSQNRFRIGKLLGQGSFSDVYIAFDINLKKDVALKIEKANKPKNVLKFEYNVLNELQGLKHVCHLYDFITNDDPLGRSFIEMELLGQNLSNIKRNMSNKFTISYAVPLLIQMLEAIEEMHNKNYIHRDIKPSNFTLGNEENLDQVFLVDFGLARLHIINGRPIEERKCAEFRGTVTYASYNAHDKKDLARRDDLWSFYFVLLDFLNIPLPWKNCKDNNVSEVKDLKEKCMKFPEKYLWNFTENLEEIKNIFFHLKPLEYSDKPDYAYIKLQLQGILHNDFIKKEKLRLHPKRKRLYTKRPKGKKATKNKKKKIEENKVENQQINNQIPIQTPQVQPQIPQNITPQQNINFNINQFSNQIINNSIPLIYPPINTNCHNENQMQAMNFLNYNIFQSYLNNVIPITCGFIPHFNIMQDNNRYSNIIIPMMPNHAFQMNGNSNANMNPSLLSPPINLSSAKRTVITPNNIHPCSEFKKIILPSIDNLFPAYKVGNSDFNNLIQNKPLGGENEKNQ